MRRVAFSIMVVAAILAVAVPGTLTAQGWVELRESGAQPEEVKIAFDAEWSNREYVRGNGFKQHERWNYFWQDRMSIGGLEKANSQDFLAKITGRTSASVHRDAGNWEPLGLADWESNSYGPGNGRINVITHDPNNSSIIYVGSPSGGIWKSTTGGSSWLPIGDQLSVLGVSGIVVSHEDSDVVYIGTGDKDGSDTYSLGIFKSTDGGQSWQTAGLTWPLSNSVRTHKMVMHPTDALTIYAATSDGLYRTLNAGVSWTKVLTGNVQDIELNTEDPSTIYAGKDRIYISTDGGDTFEQSTTGLPSPSTVGRIALAVTPADANVVYAMFADDNAYAFQGMYRSNDAGASWQLQSTSPNLMTADENGSALWGQAWYDMELTVSDTDADRVIVGGVNLWESSDGGVDWDLNSYWTYPGGGGINYVHADIHHLSFHEGTLWCGSDGGVFRSTNSGNTFTDLSAGLEISQFYRMSAYAGNSDMVIGGTQDNGTNLRELGSWTHVLGADGMEAIIHPSDPSIMFACTQYGDIHKSVDGGASFDWSASGISEDGPWVTPYIMSPVNSNVLFAGFNNVWRSTDQGASWSQISSFSNQVIRSLAMGANAPNTIYAATNTNLYKTINGGNDWSSIEAGLPNEPISYLAVDPSDAERIWCTYSGFEENEKVFYSSNGGDTWENLSANLPNCPVNCIVYDKDTDEGIYVGTDLGVYYTDETLAHWEEFGDGLPHVIVSELEINYADQKLLAATYGRGIWRSDLWEEPANAPIARAMASPSYICEGGSIVFTDQSSMHAPNWAWTFEGGTPSTSQDQQPEILYDAPGIYDYSLEVSNSAGASTWTCAGCVHVYANDAGDQPFAEGFEEGESLGEIEWYVEGEGPLGWEITQDASHFGNGCVMVKNFSIDYEEIHTLTSRPIDVTNLEEGETLYLSYWYSFAGTTGEYTDRLRVYMSADCGETYSLKQQINTPGLPTAEVMDQAFYPEQGSDWQFEIYTLEAGDISSNMTVQFWFKTGNGNNLFLDDINLSQDVEGLVLGNKFEELVLYPNPTKNMIHVIGADKLTKENQAWTIFNTMGQPVKSGIYLSENKDFAIDIRTLTCGVYTLQFSQGKHNLKFVVE